MPGQPASRRVRCGACLPCREPQRRRGCLAPRLVVPPPDELEALGRSPGALRAALGARGADAAAALLRSALDGGKCAQLLGAPWADRGALARRAFELLGAQGGDRAEQLRAAVAPCQRALLDLTPEQLRREEAADAAAAGQQRGAVFLVPRHSECFGCAVCGRERVTHVLASDASVAGVPACDACAPPHAAWRSAVLADSRPLRRAGARFVPASSLECSVCLEVFRGRAALALDQCANGHVVCRPCRARLARQQRPGGGGGAPSAPCPVCRAWPARWRACFPLAGWEVTSCCVTCGVPDTAAPHGAATCPCRVIPCPFCGAAVELQELRAHLFSGAHPGLDAACRGRLPLGCSSRSMCLAFHRDPRRDDGRWSPPVPLLLEKGGAAALLRWRCFADGPTGCARAEAALTVLSAEALWARGPDALPAAARLTCAPRKRGRGAAAELVLSAACFLAPVAFSEEAAAERWERPSCDCCLEVSAATLSPDDASEWHLTVDLL
jgi:hypothetical protein